MKYKNIFSVLLIYFLISIDDKINFEVNESTILSKDLIKVAIIEISFLSIYLFYFLNFTLIYEIHIFFAVIDIFVYLRTNYTH